MLLTTHRGKPVRPKTAGQMHYVQSIKDNDMVFAIGPAGTGKTYLAVVMAVRAFKDKEVNRIVLVRPAVEAGEKLGFCLEIFRKRLIHICVHFLTVYIMY